MAIGACDRISLLYGQVGSARGGSAQSPAAFRTCAPVQMGTQTPLTRSCPSGQGTTTMRGDLSSGSVSTGVGGAAGAGAGAGGGATAGGGVTSTMIGTQVSTSGSTPVGSVIVRST